MTSMRTIVLGLGLVAVVVAAPAWGESLYAADGAAGNPLTKLYILNPTNGGALAVVGPIGFAITGLAFDPTTGDLYGSVGAQDVAAPRSLVKINRSTGAGTLIGPFGGCVMPDIAFNATGTLFGWSDSCSDDDDLFTIDITTGAGTQVSDSGLSTFGSGLAFNAAGVLYLAGDGAQGVLRTVDPGTGVPTDGPTLSGAPGNAEAAVSALAFDGADTLFGSVLNQGSTRNAFLVTIDTSTGAVTNLGPSVDRLDAIAFGPTFPLPNPAPALTRSSMIVLAGLLAMVGIAAATRERRRATRGT